MSTRKLPAAWIAIGTVLAVALGATGAWLAVRMTTADRVTKAAVPGGPFALVDGAGRTVTDKTYRGRWELVFFGYSFCPDLCPMTLGVVADALDRLGPLAAKVQPIFVTLDPQRDTPVIVTDYVASFDKRIVGLSGTPEAIAAAAAQFRVQYEAVKTGEGAEDYLIDHTGFLYLMNPEGRFVRVLAGNITGGEMADKLRPLIAPAS